MAVQAWASQALLVAADTFLLHSVFKKAWGMANVVIQLAQTLRMSSK